MATVLTRMDDPPDHGSPLSPTPPPTSDSSSPTSPRTTTPLPSYQGTDLSNKKAQKTYNSGYSPVVTHLTTNPPVHCLSTAERTGSSIFSVLWSYVSYLARGNIMLVLLLSSMLFRPSPGSVNLGEHADTASALIFGVWRTDSRYKLPSMATLMFKYLEGAFVQ